ncbi:MAG: alpha/beta hydrolase [Candidatus Woesearchaeota archaeon]|nr:MAG: alpha/beta hydrolase [Candidatus Woesearchaeota archaeon]
MGCKIKAAFLAAGVTGKLKFTSKEKVKSFLENDFNWSKIKKHCDHFYLFHSEDDEYIPLKRGEELARNLGVKLILIKGGNHFRALDGFTEFLQLLEKIDEELE